MIFFQAMLMLVVYAFGAGDPGYVRMNRGIESNGNIYVASFVEHGPHVIASDRAGTPGVLDNQVQPWKIQKYIDIGLIDPRTDREFIEVLETTETLSRNTSLLFIRRYWRETGVSGIYHPHHAGLMAGQGLMRSKLVGLVAVAKLDLEHDEFPTEERFAKEGVRIPRSELTPSEARPEPLWIPGFERFRRGKVLSREPVVVNSHIAEENVRWLLYVLARSHGLFSYGRILPPGTSAVIQGQKLEGPLAIEAGPFVLEAVGRLYQRFYERESWRTLGSVASRDFGQTAGRDRTTFLMEMDRGFFLGPYAVRLATGAAKELVDNATWTKPQLVSLSTETGGTSTRLSDVTRGRKLTTCADYFVEIGLTE